MRLLRAILMPCILATSMSLCRLAQVYLAYGVYGDLSRLKDV